VVDCGMTIMPTLTSFSHTLTFFPKWFVKCGRTSCFGLVSRDACNELFRQHRFEKIGESFALVSCRAVSRLNAHWKH